MNRRHFIAATIALAALPVSLAADILDYRPGLVNERLAAGETVFLDFKADWCTTCRAQERVIGQLMGSNPAYGENITFINVDWDQHRNSALANDLNIPRRSTLVVLRGNEELGRIVAGTASSEIQALMDTALNAGS
ncbi:thioredoxin family protein [Yoonia sp. 208BN28-4]|uniref:thioredoxin family protein n=1 Tax=Yoonia sp. 208BN28-4 TaxID=3126505 RepID=UPI0030B4FEC0